MMTGDRVRHLGLAWTELNDWETRERPATMFLASGDAGWQAPATARCLSLVAASRGPCFFETSEMTSAAVDLAVVEAAAVVKVCPISLLSRHPEQLSLTKTKDIP